MKETVKHMKEHFNHNEYEKSEKLISDIEPIEVSANMLLKDEEDINKMIEEPLQKQIKEIIEKGIKPLSSSANKKDIEAGYGHIIIDYESLSDENKNIVRKEGYKIIEFGTKEKKTAIEFKIPINQTTRIEEVREKAKKITKELNQQPANWIPEYSIEKIMEFFYYDPSEKEIFLKEYQQNPSDFAGYYLDKNNKFYDSKWLFQIKENTTKKL